MRTGQQTQTIGGLHFGSACHLKSAPGPEPTPSSPPKKTAYQNPGFSIRSRICAMAQTRFIGYQIPIFCPFSEFCPHPPPKPKPLISSPSNSSPAHDSPAHHTLQEYCTRSFYSLPPIKSEHPNTASQPTCPKNRKTYILISIVPSGLSHIFCTHSMG